jgi:acetyl coenzyme A synthetase (ADP forming)-like protein
MRRSLDASSASSWQAEAVERSPALIRYSPVDVILRDGSTLRLREPTSEDVDELVAFFSRLSERSRFLRFHGLGTGGPEIARTFVDPDWDELGALVGTLGEVGDERIVALGSYQRLREATTAEAAFAVEDALQRRGIGTRLLEQLAERAAAHGIESFVAEVLPENEAMLRVFEDVGFRPQRALSEGVYEVRFSIEPSPVYRERVDERDHVAVRASLEPFFRPTSVVVIGASSRRGSIGGELFRNILAADFRGAAYPVNRSGEPVAGVRGFPTVDDVPEAVDLAVVCLPAALVNDAVEAVLRRGTRAVCVISAGFAEIGAEGKQRQDELLGLVRAHGARLIGPNCLGIASAAASLNATFAPRSFPVGRIGFSSQSGALGLALLERAGAMGLGVSSFFSIGNKADVSSNDLLEYWEDDPETDLILLYLESFGNPRKFGRLAKRVARRKPILAMKSGRTSSGWRAAGSHTAALAGTEAAVEALFHQAGVIRAETLEELLDVAMLLSCQPLPRGRRTAVVTNAGGLGVLSADACEAAGLELPSLDEDTRRALAEALPAEASLANPVDMLGSARADTYRATIPLLLADPGIDSVIVHFVPPVGVTAEEVGHAICDAVLESETDKTVLAVILAAEGAPTFLRERASIPAFSYPEAAAQALGRAAGYAAWLRRPAGSVPDLGIPARPAGRIVSKALERGDDGWLEADEASALLEAYGLPMVPQRLAESPEEAAAAAAEVGYPVVVKSAVAGAHKTELGAVALDLETEDEVRTAAARIGAPVVVQPMLRGGVELLAGVVHDPVFGPLVGLGAGGVLTELVGGARFLLAPLTDADAAELLSGGGPVARLVGGFRGAPPADVEALEDVLHRLSQLAEDVPELAELDLNPIIALPAGAVIVDARIRIAHPEPAERVKSW